MLSLILFTGSKTHLGISYFHWKTSQTMLNKSRNCIIEKKNTKLQNPKKWKWDFFFFPLTSSSQSCGGQEKQLQKPLFQSAQWPHNPPSLTPFHHFQTPWRSLNLQNPDFMEAKWVLWPTLENRFPKGGKKS